MNYLAYSAALFQKDGIAMAYSEIYDGAYVDEVAQFIGKVNLRYFASANEQSKQEIANFKKAGYQFIQQYSKRFLKKYVDSILVDKIDDTKLVIPK